MEGRDGERHRQSIEKQGHWKPLYGEGKEGGRKGRRDSRG